MCHVRLSIIVSYYFTTIMNYPTTLPNTKTILAFASILALVVSPVMPSAFAVPVAEELQILLRIPDDPDNFELQRDAYADALESSEVLDGITSDDGPIAFQLIYWKSLGQQTIIEEAGEQWFLLEDAEDAEDMADRIRDFDNPFPANIGESAVADAMRFGSPLFEDNGFEGNEQIMCVSTAVRENQETDADVEDARDSAVDEDGVDNIYCAAIIDEEPDLDEWMEEHVIAGSGPVEIGPIIMEFDDALPDDVADKIALEIVEPEDEEPPDDGIVGGIAAPVDFAALFVAGISSSAIWLVPTLAAITGAGTIYYTRYRQNKN